LIQQENPRHECARGSMVFVAGESGPLWRVTEGVVALQAPDGINGRLVQVAIAGDLLGMESLCGRHYSLSARALTACKLERVEPGGDSDRLHLMRQALLQQHDRGIDMVGLRTGSVSDRLALMLQLLGHDWRELQSVSKPAIETIRCELPSLGDLARTIDAQKETVCRVLGRLLPSQKPRRARAATFVPATLGLAA
jgi:hypothetical protein